MTEFEAILEQVERGLPALQLGHYDEVTRIGYIIEEGCNCVLLGTRLISREGTVVYYGSCGSIDHTETYTRLVAEGKLTDLRSFLPYRSKMPFREWLRRCHLARSIFLNPPPAGTPA